MLAAVRDCQLWMQAYPRLEMPHILVAGAIYPALGEYEKSVQEAREGIRLNPKAPAAYAFVMFNSIYLNRIDDAKAAYKEVVDRKLDNSFFLIARYQVAFFENDAAAMAQVVAKSTGEPAIEDELLSQEADTAAYSGQLRHARDVSRRAIDSALRAGGKEGAATYGALSGLREALFGNAAEAQKRAAAAMELSPGRDVKYAAALTAAFSGNYGQTQTLADDLDKSLPEATPVQFNYLPTLKAKMAIGKGHPAEAIEILKSAAPYELGQTTWSSLGWTALYPVYVRGEAYLAAHQASEAGAEFQKILDHRGVVLNAPIGALAHLQLGRAYAMQGDTAKARAAYQDFLTLWKDADQDIPILIAAKSEFAKLK
jgi:tetratricopeptide (TPR) repeat protein